VVLYARGAAGANVAIVPLAFSVTVPTTATSPGPATVKAVSTEELIGTLKVALMTGLTATF
jgi:hypothetical protein